MNASEVDWETVRATYRHGGVTFVPFDLCDDPTIRPAIDRLAESPVCRLEVLADPEIPERVWLVADTRIILYAMGALVPRNERKEVSTATMAFEDWMLRVAKIDVHSSDPYPQGLTRDYRQVWDAAWQAALSEKDNKISDSGEGPL